MDKMDTFGYELILNLYECDIKKFNRKDIEQYFIEICELIDMNREKLHFWDYEGVPKEKIPYDTPHLVGTSAVQFITTSNITIHTLDLFKKLYINIFSCKKFDKNKARKFTKKYFCAKKINTKFLIRR